MIRRIEGLGRGGIVAVGVVGLVALAAIVPTVTPLAADLALAVGGSAAMGAAGWAWSLRRTLRQLPLELAPVVARRPVDGAHVYLIRARLGQGRRLHGVHAEIRWQPEASEPVDLVAFTPADQLVGPFTLVVPDVGGAIRGPGQLRVRIRARSGGRTWEAQALYPRSAMVDGRFGGVHPHRGGISFDEDWAGVTSEADPLG